MPPPPSAHREQFGARAPRPKAQGRVPTKSGRRSFLLEVWPRTRGPKLWRMAALGVDDCGPRAALNGSVIFDSKFSGRVSLKFVSSSLDLRARTVKTSVLPSDAHAFFPPPSRAVRVVADVAPDRLCAGAHLVRLRRGGASWPAQRGRRRSEGRRCRIAPQSWTGGSH